MSYDFAVLFTSAGLISLLTLTLLEIILGVDNIIFISIIADKLPKSQQKKARNLGLILAMIVRIGLLFLIGFIIAMKTETIHITDKFITATNSGHNPGWFSIKEIILMVGGLFLMYKSVTEMHDKMSDSGTELQTKDRTSFAAIIFQIIVVDVVFSIDSILTAVGIVKEIPIMIGAVIISMGVMFFLATSIATFINKRPTIKMLALAFLVLIGFVLVCESLNYEFPKQLLYFAMAFSFIVEMINIRMRKKKGHLEH